MTNRVIKFRVWDGDKHKMFYPSGEILTSNDSEYEYPEIHQNIDVPSQGGFALCLDKYRFSDNTAIQQFTGLLDKNGKEIYEGDIVKWFHGVEDVAEVKYVVSQVFNAPYPDMCYFGVRSARLGICHFQRDDDYTVIGNIFENPELLNES